MSRRARIASSESLDSLLDTMANVVGILVVLLAVTQMQVNDAMDRIRDFASAQSASLRESEARLTTRWLSLAPDAGAVAAERERLTRALDALGPRHAPAEAERARALEAQLAADRATLAQLRIEMAGEPAGGEALQVRLPDPRPAPPRAEPLSFFVRHGRVLTTDLSALEAQIVRRARSLAPLVQRHEQIPERFADEDLGDTNLRWHLYSAGPRTLMAQLRWRDGERGELPRELRRASSVFQRKLAAADPRHHYLVFHVWSDSFAAYLAARRHAEHAGYAVGWLPKDAGSEHEGRIPAPGERQDDDPVPID